MRRRGPSLTRLGAAAVAAAVICAIAFAAGWAVASGGLDILNALAERLPWNPT